MLFKRSLWGYSIGDVDQLVNEQNASFEAKKMILEKNLNMATRTAQELDQMLDHLQAQINKSGQNQEIINTCKPILELYLSQCADYAANQADIYRGDNDRLIAEIEQKAIQIDGDHRKLQRFWLTLLNKLADVLNSVEMEDMNGESILRQYEAELNKRPEEDVNVIAEPEPVKLVLPFADKIEEPEEQEAFLRISPDEELKIEEFERPSELPETAPLLSEPEIDLISKVRQFPPSQLENVMSSQHEAPPVFDPFKSSQSEAAVLDNVIKMQIEPDPVNETDGTTLLETQPVYIPFQATQIKTQPEIPESQLETIDHPEMKNANDESTQEEKQQKKFNANEKSEALVVDHDSTILAILRIILQRDGFRIFECSDGTQASQNIDLLEPPLLAILEENSANVSGLDLIRKIRSKPEWDHCSIIMLLDHSDENRISLLLEAGANDCVSKPVNTLELVTRIRRLTGINSSASL